MHSCFDAETRVPRGGRGTASFHPSTSRSELNKQAGPSQWRPVFWKGPEMRGHLADSDVENNRPALAEDADVSKQPAHKDASLYFLKRERERDQKRKKKREVPLMERLGQRTSEERERSSMKKCLTRSCFSIFPFGPRSGRTNPCGSKTNYFIWKAALVIKQGRGEEGKLQAHEGAPFFSSQRI